MTVLLVLRPQVTLLTLRPLLQLNTTLTQHHNLYYNSPYGFCLSLCVAYLGSLQTEF